MLSVKKALLMSHLGRFSRLALFFACVTLINNCSSLTHLHRWSPGIFSYVSHSVAPVFILVTVLHQMSL